MNKIRTNQDAFMPDPDQSKLLEPSCRQRYLIVAAILVVVNFES